MRADRSSILAWAAVASFVAQIATAEDRFGMPAMAESSSPDEQLATSSSPDSHLAQSENPDDLVVGSEDLESRIAESEDPNAMVVGSQSLDQHMGHATALQDLPNAKAQLAADRANLQEARERQGIHSLSGQTVGVSAEESDGAVAPPASVNGQISSIHHAKLKLADARERSARADAAYGTMMERDYPRGEAREKIADERKLANEALEAAEQLYDAALTGAR